MNSRVLLVVSALLAGVGVYLAVSSSAQRAEQAATVTPVQQPDGSVVVGDRRLVPFEGELDPVPPREPGVVYVDQNEIDRVNAELARRRQVEEDARVQARAVVDELKR